MKLTLQIDDERHVAQTYGTAKSESYKAVSMDLDGTSSFIAESLRGLAESIYPKGGIR